MTKAKSQEPRTPYSTLSDKDIRARLAIFKEEAKPFMRVGAVQAYVNDMVQAEADWKKRRDVLEDTMVFVHTELNTHCGVPSEKLDRQ